MHISLQAVCEELDIRLEADSVLLRKTYMSLASHRTVSLTYRSDVRLKYCWTTWPSLQEEALSLLRYVCAQMLQHRQQRKGVYIQCFVVKRAVYSPLFLHLESRLTFRVLFPLSQHVLTEISEKHIAFFLPLTWLDFVFLSPSRSLPSACLQGELGAATGEGD